MIDVAEARAAIQRAVSQLVNRVGYEAEVYKHLTDALTALSDIPAPAPVTERAPVAEAKTQKAGAPGSKPRKAGVK